jgi:S1-C subfamily serine protease
MMIRRARLLPILLAILATGGFARGDEPIKNASTTAEGGWEAAAQKAQQATATVRIWTNVRSEAAEGAADGAAVPAVTVCSGVCVREGHVITAAMAGSDTRIRLTLPGGSQADAKVQVIDEYTGLALLKADTKGLVPLAAADKSPSVGGNVLTAAAWGVEQPLVSQGIVGGVDRTRPGGSYPPLLQCDLRTMETSSGSAVVNREGQLLGIVVAADDAEARRGWTYAVPVTHVERILRAAEEQKRDGVIVLKRRRPVVGMVLDQEGEAIVVQRLTAGGPAEKAGFKVGDQILTTEGVAIRSVYQAVLPSLYKQPGDTMTFRVVRDGGMQDLTVVLGGGVELANVPFDLMVDLVQPKVELQRDPRGGYLAKGRGPATRPLASPPLPDEEPFAPAPTAAEKIALLEKALDRYRTVIELQQKQLGDEQKHRESQDELIQSLRAEMDALRKLLTDKSK